QVHKALMTRRGVRRSRRLRHTRYRAPRFKNRRRSSGWLPPSLLSRVQNVLTWVARLSRWCPIGAISYELVRFDMALLQNPDIAGSDRVSNLVMACRACNLTKGDKRLEVFLADRPEVLTRILAERRAPLKDAAAVNSTRWAI